MCDIYKGLAVYPPKKYNQRTKKMGREKGRKGGRKEGRDGGMERLRTCLSNAMSLAKLAFSTSFSIACPPYFTTTVAPS